MSCCSLLWEELTAVGWWRRGSCDTKILPCIWPVWKQAQHTEQAFWSNKYWTRFTEGKEGHFCDMQTLTWAGFDPNRQQKEGHDHDHEQRGSPAGASASSKSSSSCHRVTISDQVFPGTDTWLVYLQREFEVSEGSGSIYFLPPYISLTHVLLPKQQPGSGAECQPSMCVHPGWRETSETFD